MYARRRASCAEARAGPRASVRSAWAVACRARCESRSTRLRSVACSCRWRTCASLSPRRRTGRRAGWSGDRWQGISAERSRSTPRPGSADREVLGRRRRGDAARRHRVGHRIGARTQRRGMVRRRALDLGGDPPPARRNIIEVIDRVRALLPELAKRHPCRASTSTSRSIAPGPSAHRCTRSRRRCWHLAVVLVTLVVFLFLRSIRATADPRQRGGAALAGRHLRRDVPARLLSSTTCR
jgi:hypothetical protein